VFGTCETGNHCDNAWISSFAKGFGLLILFSNASAQRIQKLLARITALAGWMPETTAAPAILNIEN
jgi:hypothetical protein